MKSRGGLLVARSKHTLNLHLDGQAKVGGLGLCVFLLCILIVG